MTSGKLSEKSGTELRAGCHTCDLEAPPDDNVFPKGHPRVRWWGSSAQDEAKKHALENRHRTWFTNMVIHQYEGQ